MRRRYLALAASAAGLAATLVALRCTTQQPAAAASRGRVFHYDLGLERRYRLTLDERAAATVAGGSLDTKVDHHLDSETHLQGILTITALEARPEGGALLRIATPELEAAHLRVADREMLVEEVLAALTHGAAFVEVDAHGALGDVQFSSETPPLVRNILMLAVTESAITLGEDDSWESHERTLQGTAASRYRIASAGPSLALTRVRDHYAELGAAHASGRAQPHEVKSHATVRIDREMFVRELEGAETLHVGGNGGPVIEDTRTISLSYLAASHVARPATALTTAASPGSLATSHQLQDQLMTSRAEGLTADAMMDTLERFGASGQLPDENRFLWRASGLLRLQPAACERVADLALHSKMTSAGRGLLLDLLVGAGTPTAQHAMLRVFDGLPATEPAWGLLYQRLALVGNPVDEVVGFSRARMQHPGPEGRGSARVAFGAIVGHRLARDPSAREDVELMRSALGASEANAETAEWLQALGNVEATFLEPELASFATSDDAGVRRASAGALRRATTDEGRRALLDLASDTQPDVQRRALVSLAGRAVAEPELSRLAAIVTSGRMAEASYEALLDVAMRAGDPDQARPLLEAIRRSNVQSRGVLARANTLLGN